MTPVVEQLLTIAEAAEAVNYDEAVILRWIARGLPHISAEGRKRPRRKDIRIRASALWEWVRGLEYARGQPPVAPAPIPAKRGAKVCTLAGDLSELSAWRRVQAKGED